MKPNIEYQHAPTANRPLLFGLAVVAVLACSSAFADLQIAPAVRIQTGHDSNLRLTSESPDGAFSNTLSVDAVLKNKTPRSELRATAGVGYNNYLNAEENTKDRVTTQGAIAYRTSGRVAVFDLTGTISKQDLVRTVRFDPSELTPLDTGDSDLAPIDPVDTIQDDLQDDVPPEDNEIVSQVSRLFAKVTPGVQFRLSQRDRLRVGATYVRRSYQNDNNVLQDSNRYGGEVEYARDIDERNVLAVTGGISFFEPNRSLNSEIYQAGITWRTKLSRLWRLDTQLGLAQVESKTDSSTGGQFGFRLRARMKNTRASARAGRNYQPNAFGNVARTDTAEIKLDQSVTNRAVAGLRVRYQSRRRTVDTSPLGDDLISDRDRLSAGLSFNYRWTSRWSLATNYEYRWIKRDNDDRVANANATSAKGNSIFTTLTYRPSIQD